MELRRLFCIRAHGDVLSYKAKNVDNAYFCCHHGQQILHLISPDHGVFYDGNLLFRFDMQSICFMHLISSSKFHLLMHRMTGENRANELAFGASLESSSVDTNNLFFEMKQSRHPNATNSIFLTNAQAIPVQVPATMIDMLSTLSTQTLMCSDMTTSTTSGQSGDSTVFAQVFPPLAPELQGTVPRVSD